MKILLNVPPIKICSISSEEERVFQHRDVVVFLNINGVSHISVNNTSHSLAEGDILVVNPNEIYTVFKSDSMLVMLSMDKSMLKLSSDDAQAYFVCSSAQYKNKDKFYAVRSSILNALKRKDSLSSVRAYALAYELYGELLENFTKVAPAARKNNTRIIDILGYIENNYTENLLLNDIADKFSLSVPYLSKIFKNSTGKTFADFYDELRVNHCMYDLLETPSTIIDIAYKHGFPNNHAFIRAFKKVTGMLPTEARKRRRADSPQDGSDEKLHEALKLLGSNTPAPSEYKDYYITEDYNNPNVPMRFTRLPCREILGVGSATSVLHKNVQNIIQKLQVASPFRYAYIRGIFSDGMSFCSRNFEGKLTFRFSMIDEVLDFLTSVNLMPVLSFTYMPRVLAAENQDTAFQDGYYICEPTDLGEWELVVTAFLQHIADRYGTDNVKKWIFLPWVQLDSKNSHLGFTDEDAFFEFYKTSYFAVKKFCPEFFVTSPEIYPSFANTRIADYLQRCKEKGCLPDAIAVKFSSTPDWEVIEATDRNGMAYRKVINDKISPDENLMRTALTNLKDLLIQCGCDMDIYVTTFNFTIADSHPLLDTLFSSAYYIKNYVDNMDMVKSMCYWKLSDDIETKSIGEAFSGTVGMFLHNGIPKSTEQGIRMLSYTKPIIIDRGSFYLLSAYKEQSDYFHLLIYNYEHPAVTDRNELLKSDDLYSAFIEKEKKAVHLTIDNLPYTSVTLKIFTLNKEHGSPYDRWKSMGMPELEYYADGSSVLFDIFAISAIPDFKTYTIPIENGRLALDFRLDEFEVKAIELLLQN